MQRSKFDIGGANAGTGGMSINSGSGGASGMGASSSSSEAGSGLDVLGEELIVGGLRHGIAELGVAACAQVMPSSCPRLVLLAQVRGCTRCSFGRRLAPPCFVHGQAFEEAIEDGAGKSGPQLRLDVSLETAEDGHVAGLQVRSASWRDEALHYVWESGLHGGQGSLAGVDAGHVPENDPRLSFFAWVHHVVQTGRELQDRGRPGPAILRCDVASGSWACLTPRRPHPTWCTGRRQEVSSMFTTRACLSMSQTAVELFHALGGLLAAQARWDWELQPCK